MRLLHDVNPIDLDDAVAQPQSGSFCWRSGVHSSDKLSFSLLVGQQVETEILLRRSFHYVAETGRRCIFHFLFRFHGSIQQIYYQHAHSCSMIYSGVTADWSLKKHGASDGPQPSSIKQLPNEFHHKSPFSWFFSFFSFLFLNQSIY